VINASGEAGVYDFREADRLVDFAVEEGLRLRGHALDMGRERMGDWVKNPVPPWEWRRRHEINNRSRSLDNAHVTCCRSFLSLGDQKFDPVTFIQGLEPFSVDFIVVNKDVASPRFTRDETVTLT
jgi:hypothetical protein